ncbi:TfoX/Sxy family protein [Microvirga thermotolerans]|uniref:Competence protein TfoX n=1 Tax=Microvirga thermotolerans TaxID=2651334 RepID=A0A5P9JY85_9HYPH|nr:TfoX/Sxy family protein [Microvirga thermotolerans]QFU16370.1 competence protein TfoX [Microvirga thermotolerans]
MDADAIRDVFRGLGPIRIRRMFGGHGIYRGDAMFALEAGGELYLKADARTAPVFEALNSRPFAYASRNGRTTVMSYWLMPESAIEDEAEAQRLGALALEAALRARAAKPSRKAARPPRRA